MHLRAHLLTVWRHNVQTLQHTPLAECAGALGDLGTLLPLMIALALKGSIDLGSTLVFSGLTNIVSGVFFGIPLPVQPMKAIAAVAISRDFSKEETAAAGLTMGIAVFVLSATGLLRWLNHIVPTPVVKGIQVGAGLSLVISAGTSLLVPLDWIHPGHDNRIWATAAFIFLIVANLVPRIPYALVVFVIGLVMSAVVASGSAAGHGFKAGIWHPSIVVPPGSAWRTGAIDAAIPQLPLTTLNSILAVTSLSAALLPDFPPPSTTALGFSVASANLVQCWFGGMPTCHGSGGLAGQFRFGARSGMSIIILGAIKLVVGLFVGNAIIPILQHFPKSLLGIMVLAAGVELAKIGQHVADSRDHYGQVGEDSEEGRPVQTFKLRRQGATDGWTVMLITAAGCLAFKNDAVGFLAGLAWHYSLRLPDLAEWLKSRSGSIKLGDGSVRSAQTSLASG